MRVVPFLLLVAVPFLVAAPVPKSRPSVVTSYSADELAKLPFVDADKIPDEWKGQGSGPKSGLLAFAVTLPKAVYDLGEPVEPLFALRNRTDKSLGLGFLLDFTGGEPHPWNDATLEIRDASTKKLVGPGGEKTLAKWAGGPEMPAKGYYTAAGNVALARDQKPLPAGDCELNWRSGWAKSNTVKFRVANQAYRGAKPFKSVRLLCVTETDEREERKQIGEAEANAPATTWDAPGVVTTDPVGAALMLGSGQLGRYYPTLRRLPEAQGRLAASVKWVAKKDEESFTVRLAVTDKTAKVTMPGRPHVYLLIETDAEAESPDLRAMRARLRQEDRILDFDHPFELTAKLPKDWADEANAPGPARVAVLVSSKELDGGWGERQEEKTVAEADGVTHFVLRTAWRDITLPKPDARKPRERIDR